LFNIWGFGFKNKITITQERVDSALSLTGMDKIYIEESKVIKTNKDVTLNFNAIAQGYTADVIASQFEKIGINNYLIEVGGEIFCKGVNPKGKKWSVGIDRPVDGNMVQGEDLQDILLLSGGGLATSGNYRKFYEEDGQKYSHTINPLTGYPAKESILSATVTAPDAMTADAYATWFMVAGVEKAIEIIESDPKIEGYLVYSQGDSLRVYKSAGIQIR
jgi:thiamine biosynthesis lipoprotein